MLRSWADLVFPKSCVGCGKKEPAAPFCGECAPSVEALPTWRCGICAGSVPPPLSLEERAREPICAHCEGAPPPFREVVAPFVYGGPVAVAIQRLKYRGSREVASRLVEPLVDAGRPMLERADVVTPIPLHPRRRRRRGFDQALLLARVVHRAVKVPLAPALLRRKTEGLHQVGRGRDERTLNIQGAFLSRGAEGLSVVLVDDVVTTGATAAAAATALREQGAREVSVLCLARAL